MTTLLVSKILFFGVLGGSIGFFVGGTIGYYIDPGRTAPRGFWPAFMLITALLGASGFVYAALSVTS